MLAADMYASGTLPDYSATVTNVDPAAVGPSLNREHTGNSSRKSRMKQERVRNQ